MKRLIALILSIILFIICLPIFPLGVDNKEISFNNPAFGLWSSNKKDASYTAISNNLNGSPIFLLGSSEFHHMKKSPSHPANFFGSRKINLMIIGSSYTQSLFHTILIGSLGNKIKGKKVIMLVSPSWFKKQGVPPDGFAAKFSESEFREFLKNKEIPNKVKQYVAKRCMQQLKKYKKISDIVQVYIDIYLKKTINPLTKLYNYFHSNFITQRDLAQIPLLMKSEGLKKYKTLPKMKPILITPDWKKMIGIAQKEVIKNSNDNPFFMSNKVFRKKIRPLIKLQKNCNLTKSYANSPEYKDFRTFIKVCKVFDIKPKFILLPLNAYWYDYTGFKPENRDIVKTKMEKICKEENVPTKSLLSFNYDKYFFIDTVHPSKKGWLYIDKEIFKFYKKDK